MIIVLAYSLIQNRYWNPKLGSNNELANWDKFIITCFCCLVLQISLYSLQIINFAQVNVFHLWKPGFLAWYFFLYVVQGLLALSNILIASPCGRGYSGKISSICWSSCRKCTSIYCNLLYFELKVSLYVSILKFIFQFSILNINKKCDKIVKRQWNANDYDNWCGILELDTRVVVKFKKCIIKNGFLQLTLEK